VRYAFIQDNQRIWPIRRLCSTLEVHHSGYYAWLKQPISKTAKKRQQLSELIKQFWLESGGIYGYRKIYCDLKDIGEGCGINRVHRLMKADGLCNGPRIVTTSLDDLSLKRGFKYGNT
jgi:putative transposase